MCNYRWRQMHEESLLSGSFPIGSTRNVTGRIGVTISGEHELVGPNGGNGNRADGTQYKRQIIHSDGRLELIV